MNYLSPGDIALMNSTLELLANATLTAIETPGPLADNGDPGTPIEVWTGEALGVLERGQENVLAGDAQVDAQTTTFLIFDAAGANLSAIIAGADWTATTVVIRDERFATPALWRFTVNAISYDVDGTLDSAKLALNAGVQVA